MASAAGGQRNLGFAVRVKQLCCQPVDVEQPVVARLQIDQSSPEAGILERDGSPQAPERRLDRIDMPYQAFRALRVRA